MQCPKCDSTMEDVRFGGVTIQRCKGCKGLWFNRSKHEYLKCLEDAESIDTGDADVGELYNKIDDIVCPECSASMIRMVDLEQPHIWYESCSEHCGVFFDAGEFRDYTEKTILDYLRDLFAGERK